MWRDVCPALLPPMSPRERKNESPRQIVVENSDCERQIDPLCHVQKEASVVLDARKRFGKENENFT